MDAKFSEQGMGYGHVVVGEKPITEMVQRTHGQDIANAYNKVVAGVADDGERKFVASWVLDAEQPKVQG